MTTNTNNAIANNVERVARRNASHANCDHENSKSARAKCRREMRLMSNAYDVARNDNTRVDVIDMHTMKLNARANVDDAQLSIDDIA